MMAFWKGKGERAEDGEAVYRKCFVEQQVTLHIPDSKANDRALINVSML